MKKGNLFFLLVIFLSACSVSRQTVPSGVNNDRAGYIRQYSDLAVQEMKRSGVPASITMAQALLESDNGNSTLARQANNHFGIKCHKDWKGRTIYHDDDRRNECFRRYNDVYDSFRDHTDFLLSGSRYAFLFSMPPDDYKGWARGLKKAGYATHPHYDDMLIRIIEENRLYDLDQGKVLANPTIVTAREKVPVSEIEVRNASSEFTVSLPTRKIMQNNRINCIFVKEGDSFFSLAKELDLMVWEIYRYNDLPRNAVPMIGQLLYIQPKRNKAAQGNEVHDVKDGDTMYSISQKYGVRLSRLYKMNQMDEDEEVAEGDQIYLRRSLMEEPDAG